MIKKYEVELINEREQNAERKHFRNSWNSY